MNRSIGNPRPSKHSGSGYADGGYWLSNPMPEVWKPGVDKLDEGQEYDISAYDSLHAFKIGWPCLSFDVVKDQLGTERTEFPHTMYCVAGTQALKFSLNCIGIVKISNISSQSHPLVSKSAGKEKVGSKTPVLQLVKVSHQLVKVSRKGQLKVGHNGGVNRIRSMTQKPNICASWADTGYVQVWDFSSYLNALAESESDVNQQNSVMLNHTPLFEHRHKDEGYAIDWNPLVSGRLVTGDCKNLIHLWEPTDDSWIVDRDEFTGHTASVEDLQWCPTDPSVFASCSVDKTIALWDIRVGKKPQCSRKVHNADVNVISWNRLDCHMLASGSEDGTISICDHRFVKDGVSGFAQFDYHKYPITSIEWSPHEKSTVAVCSGDNRLTIWNIELLDKAKRSDQVSASTGLPPHLQFVHQVQDDLKELHWHNQIPGMIISTASDGFNILKPSNIF